MIIPIKHFVQKPITSVQLKFWEGCETGTEECQTLIFNRESLLRNVFLVTPCGGTSTSVSLYSADEIIFKDSPIMKISVSTEDCPPKLTLTGLPDGEYVVNMSACHLGGGIKFSLVTVL